MFKRSKYKNKKVIFLDIEFDSNLEKDFYVYLLKTYKKEDIIVQPKFLLIPAFTTKNDEKIRKMEYIGDFQVGSIVYDVKTLITATQAFKLKEKLFKYFHADLQLICVNKTTKAMQNNGWLEFEEYKKIEKYKADVKKGKLK